MTKVKLTPNGGFIIDGQISVPNDPRNRHYQEVQVWLKNNTPKPAEQPAPIKPLVNRPYIPTTVATINPTLGMATA